jgi:hypothetical protein
MSQYRRYRAPVRQSTKALTAKLAALAIVATLLIGGLIATQMAAGNDPALGPKAVARAKKANKANPGSSASSSSGTDPYTQQYRDDGYSYGSSGSSGYSSGSGGYSSGYSTQQSSPAPVTSSTS